MLDGTELPHDSLYAQMIGRFQRPLNSIAIISGFNLTPEEIGWSRVHGILGERSITVFLKVTPQVCWIRYSEDRHKHNKPVMKIDEFNALYLDFMRKKRELERFTTRANGRLLEIEASHDYGNIILSNMIMYIQLLNESRPAFARRRQIAIEDEIAGACVPTATMCAA